MDFANAFAHRRSQHSNIKRKKEKGGRDHIKKYRRSKIEIEKIE